MVNNRHTKTAFTCSPKPTGKVCTAFGLLLLPVETNNYMAACLLWHRRTTPTASRRVVMPPFGGLRK